jgi:hypothetical protein
MIIPAALAPNPFARGRALDLLASYVYESEAWIILAVRLLC